MGSPVPALNILAVVFSDLSYALFVGVVLAGSPGAPAGDGVPGSSNRLSSRTSMVRRIEYDWLHSVR